MKQLENLLSKETSPYLLQHANNPVAWQSWNDSILKFAKDNNKLLLISIGYSACHWCHVMEHECFENKEVANLMNENFINIKVDREEHPDVDHIYMNALQIMTGHGGWPLNIIALPDGRPVWGATYLPTKKWMGSLYQLRDLFNQAPEQMEDYANKLSSGIKQLNTIVKATPSENLFQKTYLQQITTSWEDKFDWENGGFKGAPKFMMPNNLLFLLEYASSEKNTTLLDFVEKSLLKMAQRGVYDTLGGGFSRYTVDEKWHIPHFEKMLYDNAQLIELYSNAYAFFKVKKFKQVVEESINFIQRKLTHPKGYFFSALDADSLTISNQKEEGAFYCWTKKELQEILNDDFEIFAAYYNVNTTGLWEHNKYVLFQTESNDTIAQKFNITTNELQIKIQHSKNKLFKIREKRTAPDLDDKGLTSWNSLMIKAYAKAYQVFQKEEYLNAATKATQFITDNLLDENYNLLRSYKNNIKSCLEDYALFIEALIELYQSNYDDKYLLLAEKLTKIVKSKFYDEESGLFYYTAKEVKLIQRSIETQDNVIPSSNSVMAKNLFYLGKYFLCQEWVKTSEIMLSTILPNITDYYSGYSNWLSLYLKLANPFYEIVIAGENTKKEVKKIQQHFLPNKIIALSTSNLKLTNNKSSNNLSIFACRENYCNKPQNDINEVISMLQNEV
ncbi:hypothetical protein SAMN04488096_105297 [Mesonia phycicola]|uniref:Spermatogenesis-associated protein 20-like TRX domain-containing protein n=1 Tax=Mesonia phycicola TaxID=579105 RepID=A0A1M6EWF1_9FLAO|nr:thioredoxin domain-containing protein [Mesonia phycicola]SHI89752.1 hypothetical protein SAMN04488096_105297 [Mesonia phycicola]